MRWPLCWPALSPAVPSEQKEHTNRIDITLTPDLSHNHRSTSLSGPNGTPFHPHISKEGNYYKMEQVVYGNVHLQKRLLHRPTDEGQIREVKVLILKVTVSFQLQLLGTPRNGRSMKTQFRVKFLVLESLVVVAMLPCKTEKFPCRVPW